MGEIYLLAKFEGDGVVLRDNYFDLAVGSTTGMGDTDSTVAGIRLGGSSVVTENVIVSGNTFYGFPGQDHTMGIQFYHYNNATVVGNVFINGTSDGSRAIETGGSHSVDGNNANVVVGNQFRNWDPQTGDVCAIRLNANNAGYTRSESWVFDGNIFDLPDTTSPVEMDGFCGDEDKLADPPNVFADNLAYDSTP